MVDEAALTNILESVVKNISSGNLKYAELDLQSAKGMAPNDPRVWYYDGVVKARTERFSEAMESLNKAVELGMTDDADVYFYKGYCFYKTKDHAKAIDHLERAIQLDPSKELAYYYAALAYGNMANWDKAEEYVKKCLEFKPDDKDYKKLMDQIQQAR
ncbi:MAG: tetratricopeptide repeat protein [Candidatus Thorarchaeota archaeon]|nr:tetratricopeptide repeat protein [Candidatus Thorarchaeota archaeon]